MDKKSVKAMYDLAVKRYAELGIDVGAALEELNKIPVSMHCWQGDDVNGFEATAGGTSGGILATGNYPGLARNINELRNDIEKAWSLIPGAKRLNLHAIYADYSDGAVNRDELKPQHFDSWIAWAKKNGCGLDFNPTYFGHPMAADSLTLSHPDAKIRNFWIRHGQACRRIAAHMGEELKNCCIMNTWVPDGYKDTPADRLGARKRLQKSLDEVFAEPIPKRFMRDAVESKLFGIGVESCTLGSSEFYLGYAVKNGLLLCLDAGHFHPTEVISDKLSSVSLFVDEILLHVSRPVRWDSDHVIVLDDELCAIARELVRGNLLKRTHIGLDYFDGTINRIAAWVLGMRNMRKALLMALLEPSKKLRDFENKLDYTSRLVYAEELKTLPFQAVWDYYCVSQGVPTGPEYYDEIREYETKVLAKRK